ncbi:MAG: PAS domain S-box protein [Gemmatimonadetes bacterium]|nr:PAS domain S-box protein [Gemmatimonadota bacterium]
MAGLLERVAQAADLSEACSIVLDRLVAEGQFPRALLALRAEGDVRAAAWGLPDERVQAYVARLRREDDESFYLLAPALETHDPRFRELGFETCVVAPFGCGAGGTGIALLEASSLDDRTDFAAGLLQRVGPLLGVQLRAELLGSRSERLDRQRDLLTTILDAISDPVLLTDDRNDILLANRKAERLFSSGPEESEGRRRAVQVNNLLFSSFLTQGVISTGEAPSRELNLVDPTDGSDLLFEVLSAPLPMAAVRGGAVISILRDITDLKRAVAELEDQFRRSRVAEHRAREERDQLDVVLENVSDPILVTDEKSNIILMNTEAARLFVVAPDREADTAHARVVRANDTRFTTLTSDFLLQTRRRRVEEVELTDPETGRAFPVEVVSSKIVDARGEPRAIVSVVHDLTQFVENQRLARALRELNEDLEERIRRATLELEERNRRLEWQRQELERAYHLKSEFLANMSHEVRTPLNVVLGYTSLLREQIYGDLTPQQDEVLGKVHRTSQHLLALINDILDLAKIEAGKMPLHLEQFRLEELLREVSDTIEPMVRAKSLSFSMEVEKDVPTLVADRTKLKQILLNLLSNSVKFTHVGWIRVRAGRATATDRMWIAVMDSGIGIRRENLKVIFEDFRQIDQSRTREYGGTGLGLSITKKLLALLGGTISVQSRYRKGSTFTIEVPIVANLPSLEEQMEQVIMQADQAVVNP